MKILEFLNLSSCILIFALSLYIPVLDISIFPFTAFFPISAITYYVEITIYAWRNVYIGIAPRVKRNPFLLKISFFPILLRDLSDRWFLNECLNSLFCTRIKAVVELEKLECC